MKVYIISWDEAVKFDLPYVSYSLISGFASRRRLRIEVKRLEGEEEAFIKWLDLIEDYLMEDKKYRHPVIEIDLTVTISFSGFSSIKEDRALGIIR